MAVTAAAPAVATLTAACGSGAVAHQRGSATVGRPAAAAVRHHGRPLRERSTRRGGAGQRPARRARLQRATRAHVAARAAAYYRLVQYPKAGFGGFYAQIAHSRRTIDVEMYELSDATAERNLEAAAARGVRVRVLLDRAYHGGTANASAYAALRAHGVEVRWAPAGYIFHIKATTFDGRTSDVSSANLTARYYATSRDAEIVDTDPSQVRAIEATFARDWSAGPSGDPAAQTVGAPGLVWSPGAGGRTAESALAAEIRAARTSVDFESEELADRTIIAALAADARRGVDCRIVMTRSQEWAAAFDELGRAGCRVRVFPDDASALYIHEKLILDDPAGTGRSMFLGSQNASVTSLTENRELGVIIRSSHGGRGAIGRAAATFDSDFAHADPWTGSAHRPAPAPPRTTIPTRTTTTTGTPAPTGARCHPLSSAGHCYEPGEYCSDADHGMHGIAGDGEPIVCTDNDGWRWEPA
ncbi:MAG TPA: phospholipase D-like domain-containing protein [Solirubrobacteraceae bacterium]|nr:phospholipase D-like domain-containing protein [Solirubrobacteraceae bacterium]